MGRTNNMTKIDNTNHETKKTVNTSKYLRNKYWTVNSNGN